MLSCTKWLCSRRRRPLPRVMSSDNGDLPAAGRGRPRLVVFDFDNTLYAGDSGTQLVTWLIRQNWWRVIAAVADLAVIARLGFVLDISPTSHRPTVDRQCRRCRGEWAPLSTTCGRRTRASRSRLRPRGMDATDHVSTCWRSALQATGAPVELVGTVLASDFSDPGRVVGSTSRGFVGRTHHRSTSLRRTKSRLLYDAGYTAPLAIAYSDEHHLRLFWRAQSSRLL